MRTNQEFNPEHISFLQQAFAPNLNFEANQQQFHNQNPALKDSNPQWSFPTHNSSTQPTFEDNED